MDLPNLNKVANKLRQLVILSLTAAKSGHTAGSLGMADIFAYLYFNYLRISTKDPWNSKRDRLFLSNGHICPVLYASLAVRGFFSVKELMTLRDVKSKLDGHPIYKSLPGVESSSGPLGQGISQAIGSAIALKNTVSRVVCIISDGELQEGQTWEALMKLGNSDLQNITIIIDRNNIQISDFTQNVMPLEPLVSKLEAFNLPVFEINGNDFDDIDDVFKKRDLIEKPVVIVANTTPGKGVSFIENDYTWHGKVPNKLEAKKAIEEIKAKL